MPLDFSLNTTGMSASSKLAEQFINDVDTQLKYLSLQGECADKADAGDKVAKTLNQGYTTILRNYQYRMGVTVRQIAEEMMVRKALVDHGVILESDLPELAGAGYRLVFLKNDTNVLEYCVESTETDQILFSYIVDLNRP